tara:strand:+ start:216 stop:425 length:210 start_codon:yes stop_codon:yes gene_type:complete
VQFLEVAVVEEMQLLQDLQVDLAEVVQVQALILDKREQLEQLTLVVEVEVVLEILLIDTEKMEVVVWLF